jgi:small conductance mechanosensitive channel
MFGLLWLVRLLENRIVRLLTRRSEHGTVEDQENRAHTLVGVFRSASTLAIYGGGILMVLAEVGINIVPLMGGAAVLGLAVAFGAQNLIRDYFYGFMIIFENQYTVNDVVKIGDVSGQVERITLRVTVLRGLDGTVHFVPNGEITRVSNLTHGWSRAVLDIGIAYKEDADKVMEIMMELGRELRRDPDFRGMIMEMPEMLGVDQLGDSAVVVKMLMKTRPLKQWAVKREMLRRIKRKFDELGIEIPFPQRTIYHRHENGIHPEGGDGSTDILHDYPDRDRADRTPREVGTGAKS